MKFEDYMGLKDKAKKAGVENSSALKQLLHLIQAKSVAVECHKEYMHRMNEWEKNCAKAVEEEIRKAGDENDC